MVSLFGLATETPAQSTAVLMINIWFALRNPFRSKPFRMLWNRGGIITQHKGWELQLSYYVYNWLEAKIDLNWRGESHAGPWIMINILGVQFDARIFDSRHWDIESNYWAEQKWTL
jgi:hypothetical protein